MNNTTLLAAAPATAPVSLFEETQGIAGKKAYIESFNNAVFVRVEREWPATETETSGAYFFRATTFAAKGVAKAGFNVYHVYGDLFAARRSKVTVFG